MDSPAPSTPKRPTRIQIHHRTQAFQFFEEQLSEDASLEMMYIRGGRFLMGSPKDELGRRYNEGPQHWVTVPQFFMSKYPVTQAQWRAVASLEPIEQGLDPEPSHFKSEQHPVECISWDDAMEFCDRLSQLTGRSYRLPSEAEWEYACRAGTTTPFHFGETITTDLANYCGTDREIDGKSYLGSYGQGHPGIYREQTTAVDEFGVFNAFGLSDMHGNVWEWCLDLWHKNYQGAPSNGSDWVMGGEPDKRILRGGSFGDDPSNCRSASRSWFYPVKGYGDVGFRVACIA